MNGTEKHRGGDRWRELLDLQSLLYLAALAVAAFAFVVSYSHIYDLGRAHAQFGTAARLLPLSVDLLIVAASLVLFIQRRRPAPGTWIERWLPRGVLWAGIGATVAANVAYGLPHGWLSAVISGWPGAAFVGVVEMVMVTVRPVPQSGEQNEKPSVVLAGQVPVPATAYEAAVSAFAASVTGGNPLSESALSSRFSIPRSQARKIRAATGGETRPGRCAADPRSGRLDVPAPALVSPRSPAGAGANGDGSHA